MKYFLIAPEGYPFITAAFVLTVLGFYYFGFWGGLLPLAGLGFCLWFFRDPKRVPPDDHGSESGEVVISPADGRIIQIQEIEGHPLLPEKRRRVSIFMSPLNVHVNRAPIKGEVKKISYNPGKFFNAAGDKASLLNEQNAILMNTAKGFSILFVQIAGFIARRIVCHVREGDHLNLGERMGIIRFGSRVDVYLPLDAEIKVNLQEKVRAGETLLGRIPGKK
jgi:phosphatidylserine decarboxylase